MDWFLAEFGAARRFPRGLSLGCGTGALERDVRRKGLCDIVVGLDLSTEALEQARTRAADEGIDGLEYRRADFDRLEAHRDAGELGRFDIAFFHQALHHVEALESCLDVVADALRSQSGKQGLLYLDEYVGPSRNEWSREKISAANEIYRALPRSVRRRRNLTLPIDRRDPSEAIRSSEIVPQVEQRFEILERRDYGGNVLAVVHPLLDLERVGENERYEILVHLLDAEDRLLGAGESSYYESSYYTVLVARPRDSHPRSQPESNS